jgi:hypothetical protein
MRPSPASAWRWRPKRTAGIVAQPPAPNSASAAHRSHSPIRKRDIRECLRIAAGKDRLRASSVPFRYSCVHWALPGGETGVAWNARGSHRILPL